jgi:CheY-like chemotaxis protein
VDDNETSRAITGRLFTNSKLNPVVVKSGEEAIGRLTEMIEAGKPADLVFLDMEMPGMDGIETSAAIRNKFGNEAPGVFIMSAIPHPTSKEERTELGIEGVLRKPVKASALRSALNQIYGLGDSLSRETFDGGPVPIQRSRHMHVLLAEDGRVNQIVAVKLLEERGHRVTLAKDGAVAVEQFLDDTFDAILMDVHMPKLDGYGATAAIRAAESKNGSGPVPIIAMTANAMTGDRAKCLEAGMDDYLSKPIRPTELFSILERFHPSETSAQEVSEVDGSAKPDSADVFAPGEFKATFPCPDFAKELISYFPEESGGYLKDAREAIAKEDLEALHHAAHSLKGTVGNYSAKRAYESAENLDNLALEGDLEAAAKTLVECEKEVSQLGKALEGFMAESSSPS